MIDLTEDQRALRDRTLDFARREIGAGLVERDRRGAASLDDWIGDWRRCAEFGLLAATVPEAHGGHGLDVTSAVVMLEALGEGCADNGLGLALNAQVWTVIQPILDFGTDAQKVHWLPGLADGSLRATDGVTEAASGSDALSLKTSAKAVEGGYVLNGEKVYAGLAPVCDLALVYASTAPDLGRWGLSAFLVSAEDKGFRRGTTQERMGLRTVPSGSLTFEDCFVPADRRLGEEGDGAAIFSSAAEWERALIFSSHVGSMARQLRECADFAQARHVYGDAIANFQSVSNRLADMRVRLETSRLLLYRLAALKGRGEPAAMESAIAKLHISEAFLASSLDAMRIHGAKGYMSAEGIERDVRDSAGGVIYGGTSDIQRNIIASMLKGGA